MIHLKRARLSDAESMHRMQVTAFLPLLRKYGSMAINPACETLWRVREKIARDHYYFIMDGRRAVGGIRVVIGGGQRKVIAPLFILPEYQNRGFAQRAVREVERLHGGSGWYLDTLLEEPGNCHLYEKLGYHRTGTPQRVRDNMTIIDYAKE